MTKEKEKTTEDQASQGESGPDNHFDLNDFKTDSKEEKRQDQEEKEEETAKINLNLPILTAIGGFIGTLLIKDPDDKVNFLKDYNEKFPEAIETYQLKDLFDKLIKINIEIEAPDQVNVKVPWWAGFFILSAVMGGTILSVAHKYRKKEPDKKSKPEEKEEETKE